MRDLNRRDFLKVGAAAAVAGPALLDPARAFAAKKPPLPAATPQKTLEKQAQAEGGTALVYFASTDFAQALVNGFHAQYPWATISTEVMSTGAIFSKVLTETTAKTGADAYTFSSAQQNLYIRSGAASPVALVNDKNLGANADPTGYRHLVALIVQGIVSNPNLATYVPKDIFQLSTPAYKGQLSFDSPDNLSASSVFLAGHRKAWGDKKWMTWLEGLHSNNVFVTSSSTSAFQAVLTGERGMCIDQTADVLSAPSGAPVKMNFYNGTPPYGVGLMRTSYSAHPRTAELFINWSMSTAGQTAMAGTGRSPAMNLPGVATSVATLLPKGMSLAAPSSVSGFFYNPVAYTKIWDTLWHT
jgi:ABC-type Fe3+ transport system substrate-binding protein